MKFTEKAAMVELTELTIALVNTTEDVVRFKNNDGSLSTPEVIKVAFANADDLFRGIAGCEKISAEVKQGTTADWILFSENVSIAIDNPKAKQIALKATKAALAMKELYDEIANTDEI